MATQTIKNIIPRKLAENVQTTQYTAVNCACVIDKFTGTNNTGGAVTLSVHLVASGGAAGASNLIIVKSIAAGQAYTFPELVGQSLEVGGFISTIASAAASIVLSATGREVT
jgi:hypothetical protein